MKKKFLYVALGLMGIMGTLSIGVVSADNDLIVYDATGGTITVYSSDKSYGITIADKNLGASIAGTGNSSYGSYYKWGKNSVYGGGYSPSYTGDDNAWGGGNDNDNNAKIVKGYDTENHIVTNSGNRQGPCPADYHVPSIGEWYILMMLRRNANSDTFNSLVIRDYSENDQKRAEYLSANGIGTKFSNDLKIPLAGYRDYDEDGDVTSAGNFAYYWSSSPRGGSNPDSAWNLGFNPSYVGPASYSSRAFGFSVRCFKNSYIELPKKTLNLYFMANTGDIEEVGSGTVTENMTGSVPVAVTTAMKSMVNTGYTFTSSWLLSGETTAFDFENTPISGDWADASGNVYFIAQWSPITYSVEFTGTDISGTMANQEFTYGVTGALTSNAFTKNGYTFSGWTDGTTGYTDGQEVSNLTTISGDVITLTAQWTVNEHKLSFIVDGNIVQSGDVSYGTDISVPANPSKECNSFAGWTSDVAGLTTTGNMPDSDVTFTANWNYTCSRSSGGGGSSRSSSVISNDSEKSTDSQTGSKVDSSAEASEGQDNTQDSSINSQKDTTQGQAYSDEFKKAYEFVFKNGITTMDTIEKANMNKPLTRIAMAKMLSYYAINILGKKPANIVVPKFSDVTDKMDEEYDNGVTLAYQLGIMGINMPNNKFRPNDLVTRAEFGTALSRMLYGTEDGKDVYYSTHLAKLMEEGIITNDTPTLQELRGYVMIMLMRSAENK